MIQAGNVNKCKLIFCLVKYKNLKKTQKKHVRLQDVRQMGSTSLWSHFTFGVTLMGLVTRINRENQITAVIK